MIAQDKKRIPKSGCLQCHAMDKKVLGPSFKQIANKYPDTEYNIKKLKKKVI